MSYFDDNEERIIYGRRALGLQQQPATCKLCGSSKVKWRVENGRWRLYDLERQHPGNRMLPHDCQSLRVTADDFEVLNDRV